MQDHEANESVVATPWSRGGNVGARGHDAGHLSLLVQRLRYMVLSFSN